MATQGTAYEYLTEPFDITHAAVVGIDAHGLIERWSKGAQALLGYQAREILGRPAASLLTGGADLASAVSEPRRGGNGWEGLIAVRHRAGHHVELALRICPLHDGGGRRSWLVVGSEVSAPRRWELHQAVLHGLLDQSPIGIAVVDTELQYQLVNRVLESMDGVPFQLRVGRRVGQATAGEAESTLEWQARQALGSGQTLLTFQRDVPDPGEPHRQDRERVRLCASFRLQDRTGRVLGVCQTTVDVADHDRARQRLALVNEASSRIGTTLDLDRTVRELAEIVVPQVADFVAVDLLETVLAARELTPVAVGGETELRRAAHLSIQEGLPDVVVSAGDPTRYPLASPQSRCLNTGRSIRDPVIDESTSWLAQDPLRRAKLNLLGVHSHLVVPLQARGMTMGVATLLRWKHSEPFDDDDQLLVEELAARAAVCIENARRFTREHNTALALQHSLLPHGLPEQSAVEAAYRYLPADTEAGVGGDWFDVIPLSGARVALVVGDVVGHGIHAAATMGRLRTAVQTLADLDLPPDELLGRLDDLVIRLADEADATADGALVIGGTCVYAVYDPISRKLTVARAGHPSPAIAHLREPVEFPDIPAGPPLGLGGLPFESAEIDVKEGSVIAFYTDGLIEASDRDVDVGFERLCFALAHPDRPLDEICNTMVRMLLPEHPRDDVAFLVARPRALSTDDVATWDVPAVPSAVHTIRQMTNRQLTAWNLEDAAFTTELIVSELVTNAIRHATPPISLRLIRERTLICEVSDSSNTSPHLRRPLSTDEGGRGLFLVAQVAQRWGTRYTPQGKTIWAEQQLPSKTSPHLASRTTRTGVDTGT
ncbi:SpoIIE family protein phosphatase [Streptomyces sp. CA-135486]|uniref:SpoIIE family protein phosphatase n=1 Tax=Streptomyces sp. CA-135486 TaxID=3240049 RepID=UPI003D8F5E30